MRYVSVTASVAAVGLLLSCSGSRETGNNSQMKAAIESAWNATNLGFVTSEVRFIDVGMAGRRPDASKGEDAISELPLYRAFAAKGLLTITAERDLTSRFSGWNDWLQLTQSGVRLTARITLTEKGRQTGEVRKVGDVEELFLRLGEAKIEDIVANDALVLGADRYRIVLGTHTFVPAPARKATFPGSRGESGTTVERRLSQMTPCWSGRQLVTQIFGEVARVLKGHVDSRDLAMPGQEHWLGA
jgi:hypothetical protein